MTAALPWTSVGVATGYRGNPRVSTARATAHGASTANATVVATARAAVLSVVNSVVPTMATHGSPRQLPRQFPRTSTKNVRPLPRQSSVPRQFPRTSNHSNFHGHPRPSAAIATAILRYAATTTKVSGNCHGNFRGRQTTAISTAIRGNPPIHGNCHGSPRQSSQQFPRHSAAIRVN